MKTEKSNKRGVSLIVLVITIIVMIILAAAVVISLSNSGIISKANEAVDATNFANVQHLATMLWTDAFLASEGKATADELEKVVINGLSKLDNINLSDYEIIVTENGVTVSEVPNVAPLVILKAELGTDINSPISVENSIYTLEGTVIDDDGVKSLTVNGSLVEIDEAGAWSIDVELVKNEIKEITIVATDNKGSTTTLIRYVTCLPIYYNHPYTATTNADGSIVRQTYVFYEDGSAEIYGDNNLRTETLAAGTCSYSAEGVTIGEQTFELSADGLSLSNANIVYELEQNLNWFYVIYKWKYSKKLYYIDGSMTWKQWIASDYNVDGYQSGTAVYNGLGMPNEFVYEEEKLVNKVFESQLIIEGHVYFQQSNWA